MINENSKIEENKEEINDENFNFELITNSDDYKNNNDKENNNNINTRYISLNDLFKTHKEQKQKEMNKNDLLGSEEIFIDRQKQIQILKKRNLFLHLKKANSSANNNNNINKNTINNHSNNLPKNINNLEELINANNSDKNPCDVRMFSLNDYKNFEYSIANIINETDENNSETIEIENALWNPLNDEFPFSYEEDILKKSFYNYMEINKLALRVIDEIDYDERGIELNINFNLIEQSELWIFTRCFVNKSINDSYFCDDKSKDIDENDAFNKYTSLIKIIKDMKSNRCFITFGTFYNEINENYRLYYKTFLKRHLIDYSDIDYDYYYKRNKTEFNIIINDSGEEFINSKIYLNDNLKANIINGKLFLPINKKAKILICGRGKSVQLKELTMKIFDKRKYEEMPNVLFEGNDSNKNCECCNIF